MNAFATEDGKDTKGVPLYPFVSIVSFVVAGF